MSLMRDEITRTIDIHAPLEAVWALVSEPGWWINDGTLGGHRIERDGSTCRVHDPTLGTFPVGIEVLDPPHRAVFTWLAGERDDSEGDAGMPRTRIEFVLAEERPGTVTLTVTESGFDAMTTEQHERNYGDNVSGWELEISLARDALEARGPHEGPSPQEGADA